MPDSWNHFLSQPGGSVVLLVGAALCGLAGLGLAWALTGHLDHLLRKRLNWHARRALSVAFGMAFAVGGGAGFMAALTETAHGRVNGMEVVSGDFALRARRVFDNLKAVCQAAGGSLQDIVKLNIYLTDLNDFATLNEVMATYFQEPYPARAAVGVAALPKGVLVEMEAVMVLP